MTPANAPPAIPAATVVVLRAAGRGSGIETLMLHKSTGHAFADMWVFPGGRVDPSDGSTTASRELDRARHAAVRETSEETGVDLDPGALVAFAHWTPPSESPRRFATWFFVVEAPYRLGDIVVDGGEIIDHVWTAPHEALARQARREIQLATPTWVTLHELAKYADPPEAVEAARARGVEYFATRLAELNGTKVALWAGDAAYATGDATRHGARHRLCMPSTGAWTYQRTADR